MKYVSQFSILILVLLSATKLRSQTLYTYTGVDNSGSTSSFNASWSDPNNWKVGSSTAAVAPGINGQTTDQVAFSSTYNGNYASDFTGNGINLGIDYSSTATLSAIDYGTGVSALTIETNGSGQTISINGAILNSSSNVQNILAPIILTGNTSLNGGASSGASLVVSNISVGTYALTSSNLVSTVGNTIDFAISSDSNGGYGHINVSSGTFDADSDSISFSGSYTGHIGDRFQLFSGSGFELVGATINPATLPTLSSGLIWNYANFDSTGAISVSAVPEPTTSDLLMIGCGLLMLFFILPTVIRRNRVLSHHPVHGGSLWWMNEMVDSE